MRFQLFVVLSFSVVAPLASQSAPVGTDLQQVHDQLRAQATALLERYGDTFYGLGGLLTTDGEYEEFATDHWPDLQAAPSEWEDSLIAAFVRSARPVRAAAILIDMGRPTDEPPVATVAIFHGETPAACQELREPFEWLADGHIAWGQSVMRPCEHRLLPR
jgi:hypothetical protein